MNDVHALSGAYAVDALDDIERAHFERHLDECASCRWEVDSLQEAAALLGETTSMEPPASLRDRVLADVATVRPLPPVLTMGRARSNRRRLPALVAAAAALIAFGGAGATVWHPWSDETVAPPTVSAAQRVLNSPDAEEFSDNLGSGATMTVTRSAAEDRAVLSATGLGRLPEDQVYELWLVHDDEMVSAGLMTDPTSAVVLQGDPHTATDAGITIEDVDGPPGPDLARLLGTVPLESS